MSLKNKNWLKMNSVCNNYYEIFNKSELKKYLLLAKKKKLKLFILGEGSNVLLSEDLNQYLILKFSNKNYQINDNQIYVDSGFIFDEFIELTLQHNLIGLEHFSLIPGNIGGITFMNIHYKDKFISNYIKFIHVFKISNLSFLKLNVNEINYSYTDNFFKKTNDFIITGVTFELKKGIHNYNPLSIRKSIIENRKLRYPNSNTCGCFFYNIDKFEGKEKSMGYQIEKLNIDNLFNFNNVKLFKNHKNMFVTNDNCKSSEILELAIFISKLLVKKINYHPKAECRLIGFDDNEISDLV